MWRRVVFCIIYCLTAPLLHCLSLRSLTHSFTLSLTHTARVCLPQGPIGVEMALNLVLANKYTVTLIEKGPHVAFHIQDYWAQVQLFSPNSLNMSATGRKILQERGVPIPDENAYFSGGKFAQEYLVPLLKFLQESDKCSVVFNTNVESVGRKDAPKHRSFPGRSKRKFHLLCSSGEYESFYEADSGMWL
jgi:hypothetical protein